MRKIDFKKSSPCMDFCIGTKVPKEIFDKVKKDAKKSHTTNSWVLRRILEVYYDK